MKKKLSALLALLLCAMLVLSACSKDGSADATLEQQIAALTQENTALKEQIDVLTRQLESIQNAVLTDWDLTATATADRNDAVITFSAVPAVAPEGQTVSLVVLLNGEEVSRQDLTLTAGEADGTFEAPISAVTFTTPALEDDHQLDLVLEITLSAGDPLTNNSCSWYYIDGGLTMVVG